MSKGKINKFLNQTQEGLKSDKGKLEWSLLPFQGMEDIVKVLMYGAKKYAPYSWIKVEDGEKRYLDAAFRHLTKYSDGYEIDEESGLPHLAHAASCLIFIQAIKKFKQENSEVDEIDENDFSNKLINEIEINPDNFKSDIKEFCVYIIYRTDDFDSYPKLYKYFCGAKQFKFEQIINKLFVLYPNFEHLQIDCYDFKTIENFQNHANCCFNKIDTFENNLVKFLEEECKIFTSFDKAFEFYENYNLIPKSNKPIVDDVKVDDVKVDDVKVDDVKVDDVKDNKDANKPTNIVILNDYVKYIKFSDYNLSEVDVNHLNTICFSLANLLREKFDNKFIGVINNKHSDDDIHEFLNVINGEIGFENTRNLIRYLLNYEDSEDGVLCSYLFPLNKTALDLYRDILYNNDLIYRVPENFVKIFGETTLPIMFDNLNKQQKFENICNKLKKYYNFNNNISEYYEINYLESESDIINFFETEIKQTENYKSLPKFESFEEYIAVCLDENYLSRPVIFPKNKNAFNFYSRIYNLLNINDEENDEEFVEQSNNLIPIFNVIDKKTAIKWMQNKYGIKYLLSSNSSKIIQVAEENGYYFPNWDVTTSNRISKILDVTEKITNNIYSNCKGELFALENTDNYNKYRLNRIQALFSMIYQNENVVYLSLKNNFSNNIEFLENYFQKEFNIEKSNSLKDMMIQYISLYHNKFNKLSIITGNDEIYNIYEEILTNYNLIKFNKIVYEKLKNQLETIYSEIKIDKYLSINSLVDFAIYNDTVLYDIDCTTPQECINRFKYYVESVINWDVDFEFRTNIDNLESKENFKYFKDFINLTLKTSFRQKDLMKFSKHILNNGSDASIYQGIILFPNCKAATDCYKIYLSKKKFDIENMNFLNFKDSKLPLFISEKLWNYTSSFDICLLNNAIQTTEEECRFEIKRFIKDYNYKTDIDFDSLSFNEFLFECLNLLVDGKFGVVFPNCDDANKFYFNLFRTYPINLT